MNVYECSLNDVLYNMLPTISQCFVNIDSDGLRMLHLNHSHVSITSIYSTQSLFSHEHNAFILFRNSVAIVLNYSNNKTS